MWMSMRSEYMEEYKGSEVVFGRFERRLSRGCEWILKTLQRVFIYVLWEVGSFYLCSEGFFVKTLKDDFINNMYVFITISKISLLDPLKAVFMDDLR